MFCNGRDGTCITNLNFVKGSIVLHLVEIIYDLNLKSGKPNRMKSKLGLLHLTYVHNQVKRHTMSYPCKCLTSKICGGTQDPYWFMIHYIEMD